MAKQTPKSNPQLLEDQKWPSCTRSDHQLPHHKLFHQLTSQTRADRSSSQGLARATRAGSLSFRNIPLRLRAAPFQNSCLSRSLTRSSPIVVVCKPKRRMQSQNRTRKKNPSPRHCNNLTLLLLKMTFLSTRRCPWKMKVRTPHPWIRRPRDCLLKKYLNSRQGSPPPSPLAKAQSPALQKAVPEAQRIGCRRMA